jgi:carbonic anhydrase
MCEICRQKSRRSFLASSLAGAAAVGMMGWSAMTPAAAKVAPTSLTPDEALAKLKEGNARFVKAPELCASGIAMKREALAQGQAPWATVLACADSRVHPEMVFGGLELGELFVCRNAGNMADTATMGTIEYGAEHLGSPLVVVLGHERCGAVAAACEVAEKGTDLPGFIGPMVGAILPAAIAMRGKDGDYVHNVVRENARRTALRITEESTIVSHLAHDGKVKVVYAVYDLDTGVVEFLG